MALSEWRGQMKVKAEIKPGMNGSKCYTRQQGGQLVCVHYRFDMHKQEHQHY